MFSWIKKQQHNIGFFPHLSSNASWNIPSFLAFFNTVASPSLTLSLRSWKLWNFFLWTKEYKTDLKKKDKTVSKSYNTNFGYLGGFCIYYRQNDWCVLTWTWHVVCLYKSDQSGYSCINCENGPFNWIVPLNRQSCAEFLFPVIIVSIS